MSIPDMDPRILADVARIFAVLGEPNRLRILECLRGGPRRVSDLVEALAAKQANVSKQLGVLHTAGLVGRQRQGTEVHYFIADPLVNELCDLVCSKIGRDAHARVGALKRRRAPKARP